MATVTEEQEKVLRANFEAASRKVKQQLIMKSGGGGSENDYSDSYQALVRAGLEPQLRVRYR